MQDNPHQAAQQSTERWTSPAYQVKFGQIAFVEPDSGQESAFHMSAWGLSQDLRSLLSNYSDRQIQSAADWLTVNQNVMIANMLEQMSFRMHMEGGAVPPLEQLFIAIDAEMFLPGGLRMLVTCVTNIISYDDPSDSLDKFVAILDPSEAPAYIRERRGMTGMNEDDIRH